MKTLALTALLLAATGATKQWQSDLAKLDRGELEVSEVNHRGRRAVRVVEAADRIGQGGLVLIRDSEFSDGTIEAEVSGAPRANAPEGSRGFVGIAFRVQPDRKHEVFYLRPTNGRAEDQLRRNHSTQYASDPEWPWHRLRKEHPGVYESYVDLVPGEWTKIKIVVHGKKAQLFVHGAGQPALIVNDLKLPEQRGKIALWVGSGTEAYFRNVKWTAR